MSDHNVKLAGPYSKFGQTMSDDDWLSFPALHVVLKLNLPNF